MDTQTAATLVGWALLLLTGGIAVGKVFGRMKAIEEENQRIRNMYADVATKETLKESTHTLGREIGQVRAQVERVDDKLDTVILKLTRLNGDRTR